MEIILPLLEELILFFVSCVGIFPGLPFLASLNFLQNASSLIIPTKPSPPSVLFTNVPNFVGALKRK